MTSIEEADSWIGRTAVDATGEQIGRIAEIWVDDASGQPEWASLQGGALKGRGALVPLAGSSAVGGGRQFAYTREQIDASPRVARDGHLEVAEKDDVSAYYDEQGEAPVAPAGWTDLAGYGQTPLSDGPSQADALARGSFPRPSKRRTARKAAPAAEPAPAESAPAAPAATVAPAEHKEGRRLRRKSAPPVGKPVEASVEQPADKPADKAGRRFRRKAAPAVERSTQEAAEAEMALGA